MASIDRTRALIGRHVGVELAVRTGDGYRDNDASLLAGEWLGAFAQPAVILNSVSAMSVRLDDQGGASIDEYGEATLVDLRVDGDRVAWRKRYARSTFVYVGRRTGGVIAGYWYAPIRPAFRGVFWLGRADHLTDPAAAALRRRVRSTSPRRMLVKVAFYAMFGAILVGGYVSWMLEVAGLALFAAFVGTLRARTRALQAEAAAWRRELGAGSDAS